MHLPWGLHLRLCPHSPGSSRDLGLGLRAPPGGLLGDETPGASFPPEKEIASGSGLITLRRPQGALAPALWDARPGMPTRGVRSPRPDLPLTPGSLGSPGGGKTRFRKAMDSRMVWRSQKSLRTSIRGRATGLGLNLSSVTADGLPLSLGFLSLKWR